MLEICLIVAHARRRVIGRANRLPWHLPEDLAHFKALTLGCPVLMGRNTAVSLPKALPGRLNLVLTRHPEIPVPSGMHPVGDLAEALRLCPPETRKLFVIGGGELYRAFIEKAHRAFITEIDADFEGDAVFPEFSAAWQLISSKKGTSATFPHSFVYSEWARVPSEEINP